MAKLTVKLVVAMKVVQDLSDEITMADILKARQILQQSRRDRDNSVQMARDVKWAVMVLNKGGVR